MKLWLLLICALSALAADSAREILTQAAVAGGQRVPKFRHGYLVSFPAGMGPTNAFSLFAPDGKLVFDTAVELPGGSRPASVSDVDVDASGNAVIAASSVGNGGCMLHGMLILDRTGHPTRFIDTDCFVVTHVAIAPDHSIWSLGWQRKTGGMEEDDLDYMIVRQFSFDGRPLGAFLPRSSFPRGLVPGAISDELGIQATADRVGVFVYAGNWGKNREWIETDQTGKILERTRIDNVSGPVSVALTAKGRVFFQKSNHPGVFALESQKLRPISTQQPSGVLMGADGDSLVYRKSGWGPVQLQWVNEP